MASKGERTRQMIVDQALQLFSVKGYYHTSISDIQAATGLTKGGLYCHYGSKEDIWYAVYDKAVAIWREIVFRNTAAVIDPLLRIEIAIESVMRDYLGAEVFDGGCFFVNMLVELSGQSTAMSRRILKGFVLFARLLRDWLKEAEAKGRIRPGLDHREIADFIIIALNGAATLYIASRDPQIWQQTINQLKVYLHQLGPDGA